MKINPYKLDDIITFDSEIKPETIGQLIEACHRIVQHNKDAKILIYFASSGGSFSHTLTLLDFLNSIQNNVTLYAFHNISSAAFYLFYSFKGKKAIMNHTYAIVHRGSRSSDVRTMHDEKSFDFFMEKKVLPSLDKAMFKLFTKLGMEKDMLDAVKNGKDVMLHTSLLRKYLAKK